MSAHLVLALIRRDWQIARTHRAPFLLDGLAVLFGALIFFYLGRTVSTDSAEDFFSFAVAGLAILRLHTAVPRILDLGNAEIAGGTLELLVSSPQRTGVIGLGSTGFELLRAFVLAILLLVLASIISDAPFEFTAAGVAAIGVGLGGAAVVFAALALVALGTLMVMRQARALGALSTMVLPVLAGAYFPISVLPEPLESIANVLPFHQAVDVIREGLLEGTFDAGASAILLAEAVVCLGIGLYALDVGIERARRAGSLSRE